MAKILLVEDDNNLRDIYGERLMAEGYEIISASDGEEALQMAAQQKPDLIISDVMMPKISGFDMLDILRQTPETKNVKIIMMTALSQAEDKSRADKLGADKYLVKSQVTLEDVARVVHDLLGDAPAEEAAPDQSQQDNQAQQAVAPTVTEQPVAVAPKPAAPNQPAEQQDASVNTPVVAPVPGLGTTSQPEPSDSPAGIPSSLPPVPNNDDLPSEPMPSTTPTAGQFNPSVGDSTPSDSPSASQTFSPTQPAPDPTAQDGTMGAVPQPSAVPEPATTPAPSTTDDSAGGVNPISGTSLGTTPTQDDAQAQSTTEATSTVQEIADVQKQIENFVAQDNEVSEHTEPLQEPSEQDLVHAKNANEDPKVVPAAAATQNSSTSDHPDSQVSSEQIPDPSVPPIVKPQIDTANPEPVSNRKKIIQPINDVNTPDIHKLYEEQMAAEAASTDVASNATPQATEQPAAAQPEQAAEPEQNQNPQSGQEVAPQFQEEQVFNPIAASNKKPEEQAPELETVDVNSITGMQEPEEESSDVGIPGQLQVMPNLEPDQGSLGTAAATPQPEPGSPELPPVQPQATANMPTPPEAPSAQPADGLAVDQQTPTAPAPQSEEEQKPVDPNNFAL